MARSHARRRAHGGDDPHPATQIFEGDLLFIEWNAKSESTRADDGIEFVFRDGEIRAQTVRYTLQRT